MVAEGCAKAVGMSGAVGFDVRRVEFRNGTPGELEALHAVEVPVAAECGSNRMPAPLESYVALARNLPSQFIDHAWLVEHVDGSPIGAGFRWSNSAGDERVMECDVLVLPASRRQGVGSRLLAVICKPKNGNDTRLCPLAVAWERGVGSRRGSER